MSTVPSLPPVPVADVDHFDRLHRASTDPWHVRSRWYERRKRDVLMAVLPRERYGLAFEPGCSIGGNTAALAQRCDHVVACDSSVEAVRRAGEALAPLVAAGQVQLHGWSFPLAWPAQLCDLVVMAELGYYLDQTAFDACWSAVEQHLAPGGELVLCHWRPRVADAFRSGDAVHASAASQLALTRIATYSEERFRIDVWRKAGGADDADSDRPTQEAANAPEPT